MIGCCYKFIQTGKTGIFKALKAILAQVKSYHFVKSLSSLNRLVVPLSHLGHLSPQCLATCLGLTLTLSQGLMPQPF